MCWARILLKSTKSDIDAILKAFPRLGFKGAFITDVHRCCQEASCRARDEVLCVISGNAMWKSFIRRTSAIWWMRVRIPSNLSH